jgi:hypothetical protein
METARLHITRNIIYVFKRMQLEHAHKQIKKKKQLALTRLNTFILTILHNINKK